MYINKNLRITTQCLEYTIAIGFDRGTNAWQASYRRTHIVCYERERRMYVAEKFFRLDSETNVP